MKKVLQGVTRQTLQMIARTMIVLVVLGFFESSVYSQITGTTSASRCGAGTVTLLATASSGTITWYAVPFYGTPVGTGSTFTTPSLSVTTTYFVDALDGSGCSLNTNQARLPVIATISASAIQAIIFYSSSTYCNSLSTPQPVTQTGTPGGVYTYTLLGQSSPVYTTPSSSPLSIDINGTILPSASTNGSYTISYTVVPPQGCTESPATTNITITTAPLQSSISYTGTPFCTSLSSVPVNLTNPNGGTFSATPSGLDINASSGTILPAGSLGGTYTVTYFVSGAGGCAPQSPTTQVTVTTLPTAVISYATAPYCQDISTLQTPVLTGTGAYTGGTYGYTGPGTLTSFSTTTGAFIPSTSGAGLYTITYTIPASGNCASVPETTTVTVNIMPTASISGGATVCQNATPPNVTFTGLTGIAPFTFTYTVNEGGTQTVSTTSGNSITVAQSTISAGTYVYTLTGVTDNNGCSQTASGTATIVVTGTPVADFAYTGSPYCKTGTVSPTFLNGGIAGTFSGTGVVFVSTATGEIDLANTPAGLYTITNYISDCGGVSSTAPVTITALPTASISGITPACSSTTLTATTNASTPSYIWYKGGVAIDGQTASTLVDSVSGSYTVNITDGSTFCTFTSSAYPVIINGLPAPTITGNNPVCDNSTLNVYATQTGMSNYVWAISGGTITAGGTSTSATATVTWTTVGSEYISVNYNNGSCSAASPTTYPVIVNALPVPNITGNTPVCLNSTNTYTTASGMTGYSWTVSTGGTINGSSTDYTVSVTWNTSGAQSVSVNYTDTHSCTAALPTTYPVTVNALPIATISYGSGFFCATGTATVTQGGQTGGTYSGTSGLVINPSTGDINLATSTTGTSTITYSFSNGTCSNTTTAPIHISALPTATISYGGSTFCATGTVMVTLTGNGISSGTYMASPNGLSISSSTGTINLASSSPGTYTVTCSFTDAENCSNTATTGVTVYALPTILITPSGPTTFCSEYNGPMMTGPTVTLTASGGTTGHYVWSNSAITDYITVSTSGSYTVTGTDGNGCSNTSAPTVVTVNPVPTANAITGNNAVCMGSTLQLTSNATGTPILTYTWASSNTAVAIVSSTGLVSPLSAGSTNITYTVTDGSSTYCQMTSPTFAVTVNALPVAGAITGGSAVCMGSTLQLTSDATGTPTLTYTWASSNTAVATVSSTGLVSPLSAGSTNITYTVTDGSSTQCQATSAPFTVTVNSIPDAPGITVLNNCNGTATLTATGVTGSLLWSTTQTINPIIVSANGTYTVTQTLLGCTSMPGSTTVTLLVHSGTDWYVSNSGNDANIGTSDCPFATIQHGINSANTSDVVHVAEGTYTELVTVNKGVTLQGVSSATTIIKNLSNLNGNEIIITVAANNVTLNDFTVTGFVTAAGTGTTGIYFNSTVDHILISNVVSSIHNKALFADVNANVSHLTLINTNLTNSAYGFFLYDPLIPGTVAKMSNLSITNGSISDNFMWGFGSYVVPGSTGNDNNLTGVTITGTTFNNNALKGLYFETLNNAVFTNLTINNSGSTPVTNGGTSYLIENAGIDINLKGGTYSNIQVLNSTISGCGLGDPNGGGILVKARSTGGYSSTPATLTGVVIDNNFISNNGNGTYSAGIRIGESFGSMNGLDPGPTNVAINDNSITGNSIHAIRNATSSTGNVAATCNWYGSADYNLVWPVVSGAVTFVPYLVTSNITTPVCTGEVPLVHNTTRNLYYNNIQDAINAATADNELDVSAGTYTEVGQIVISQNLSIVGADKTTTIIKPNQNTTNSGDGKAWWLVNQGVTFNLSNVTLDGTVKMIFHGIRHKGTGTIQNVHFTGITYNASTEYAGFAIYAFGQCGAVNVSNCEFDNIGREGIAYWGAGTTGTYASNTYTGKGLGNWLDYGVEVTNSAVATITGSTITNCRGTATLDGSASAGIIVLLNSQATITGSTLIGNFYGINVGYTTGTETPIAHANNNIISGNYSSGAQHASAYGVFDATNNYWGNASGPYNLASNPCGTGNAVSDNVTFSPWWTTSTGVDGSGTAQPITAAPVVTSPIFVGATSVSGTSESGASVTVYVNGINPVSVTATGTAWTATVPALSSGNTITAYATASGKCISLVSNSVTVLGIGDAYQGGIIFYFLQSSDPGYVTGETHGFIAAKVDQSSSEWSTTTVNCYGTSDTPASCQVASIYTNASETASEATSQLYGMGKTNTSAIIARHDLGSVNKNSYAAGICSLYTNADYGTGIYSDWYLPSYQELSRLFANKDAVGFIPVVNDTYWTSSEQSSTNVWQLFFNGSTIQSNAFPKLTTNYVRAIRSF